MKAPLDIHQLTKKYEKIIALDNLSFSLEAGEIFGLLGPNGAGKTTTLSIIFGIETPFSGRASVFGIDVLSSPLEAKKLMGIVPQEITSNGFFTVMEFLVYLSGFFGIKNNEEWLYFLLKKLDLYNWKDHTASQLSGGMKRRFMIAKALVHKPKLLFLDEPTAGVDVELRETLWNFILELNRESTTILLTTHYLEEAEKLCNRIGVISQGKLLRLDKTKTLIEQLTYRKITFHLKKEALPVKSSYLLSQEKTKITFQIPRGLDISTIFFESNIDVTDIHDIFIHEGTLEEAFRNVLGGVV